MYVTVACGKIAKMKQRSTKEGNEREFSLGFHTEHVYKFLQMDQILEQ